MTKTIEQINAKIKKGEAVVVTAEEMIGLVREKGLKKTAEEVDVVTTGTFGPMCSSGAFLNVGHAKPKIKMGGGTVHLNNVTTYGGLAAVDLFIGATAYGTDCYPRKELDTEIRLKDINEAILFNPRNAYQNYNVAVNLSDKPIYTYMGTLKPNVGNANYCSAGQLSPLLNDPLYRTMGLGTRIFLGGGVGYVTWYGTQHNPGVPRGENGVPLSPAGTLAVIGDLKQMSDEWLRGASFQGYGCSLTVGLGIPIPVLDEDVCRYAAVADDEIFASIVDYSEAYPQGKPGKLGQVSYAELKSGTITVNGKDVPTAPLSSYPKAKQIAETLKEWIQSGEFLLGEPVMGIPGPDSGHVFRPLAMKA
jgi:uncharacterized protein (DUF39 family)